MNVSKSDRGKLSVKVKKIETETERFEALESKQKNMSKSSTIEHRTVKLSIKLSTEKALQSFLF
jgi:lysyl-tRNA synthetase class II